MDTGKLTVKGLLDSTQVCKAWVNFQGTGTVAIRAGWNVSSITDYGTGIYVIHFNTPLPDSNYSVVGSYSRLYGQSFSGPLGLCLFEDNSNNENPPSIANFEVSTLQQQGFPADFKYVCVAVFR